MSEFIEPGIFEAFAEHEAAKTNPVAALMFSLKRGANVKRLLLDMNKCFGVVKYGGKTVIASIIGKELEFMKPEDFHNMLANLVVQNEIEIKDDGGTSRKATQTTIVSKEWFKWKDRRQYVGRGVVFEPGAPPEIPHDMLNLWRGFGVEPKQGDWSLMRNHIRDVICSGNNEHFQYVIRWMAYGVQHTDRPIGVAIALRGEEGAGKGFLWRNYGKLYGKHFKHVAQGDHLTGRFNAALAETTAVFLDEALWAGDRKGEQILKALVTEDTFQLERKFCDPIPVKNRLRIMIASNNQWIVPVGTRGRRYCVLDVSNQYADENDPAHAAYWRPLQARFSDNSPDEGRAAMLYDLQHMDLSTFNVRVVPKSAAKTEQKLLSLHSTESWLRQVLQDGAIGFGGRWQNNGLTVSKDSAYDCYKEFSKLRHEWQPAIKELWSKTIRTVLGQRVRDTRQKSGTERVRSFQFASLADCRRQFANHIGAPDVEWEPEDESELTKGIGQTAKDVGKPIESVAPQDASESEWESELEPDDWSEYDPVDECE